MRNRRRIPQWRRSAQPKISKNVVDHSRAIGLTSANVKKTKKMGLSKKQESNGERRRSASRPLKVSLKITRTKYPSVANWMPYPGGTYVLDVWLILQHRYSCWIRMCFFLAAFCSHLLSQTKVCEERVLSAAVQQPTIMLLQVPQLLLYP